MVVCKTEHPAIEIAAADYAALAADMTCAGFVAAVADLGAGKAGLEAQIRRRLQWAEAVASGPPWLTQQRSDLGGWLGWLGRHLRRRWDASALGAVEKRARTRLRAGRAGRSDARWLGLLAPDGYLRQAAVEQLSGPIPNPFLAGVALRRLNDWVPAVRIAARERLPGALRVTAPDIVGPAVAMALRQGRIGTGWGRTDTGAETLLATPETLEAVVTYLERATAGPGVTVLPELLRAGCGDAHLRRLALRAVQPGVRAIAVRALVSGTVQWAAGRRWQWVDKSLGQRVRVPVIETRPLAVPCADMPEMIRFASDRSARVRRAVLDGLDEARPEGWRGVAARLREDPWPSIRHRADVRLR